LQANKLNEENMGDRSTALARDLCTPGNAGFIHKSATNEFSVIPSMELASAISSWRYQLLKRAIDVCGSLVLINLAALPAIIIAACIAIRGDGPIFFTEMRVGRHGKLFQLWKFRTMRQRPDRNGSMEAGISDGKVLQWRIHKTGNDPRVTRIGAFLRKWSLDELPQLFNVLRGEMSLIGPRPVVEGEMPLYGQLSSFYLAATPGLSGLWQVSGRSNVNFATRARLDASYVENWSLLADFRILALTVPAVLMRMGAR
jgi:lipopolysaccharide/colanic/teichoic acid biosynthesis glycosyltransferase